MGKTRVVLSFILIVSSLALAGCSDDLQDNQSAEVSVAEQEMPMLDLVPEDTQVLLKFEGLETVYENIAVSQDSILGLSLEQKDIEQMKTNLGFNPLDLQQVRQAGFNSEEDFCLAVTNIRIDPDEKKETDFDVLGLLPVSDGDAAIKTIRASLEKKNNIVIEEKKDAVSYLKWRNQEAEGCMAVKDQYLYMTVNSQNDPQTFLESVLEGKSSLTSAEAFRKIVPDTDFTRDLVAYFNIADLVKNNADQIKQATADQSQSATDTAQMIKSLEQFSSASATADLGSTDLNLNTIVSLAPDSDIKKFESPDLVNRDKILSIADPAALLLSFGVDMTQYYKMITDSLPAEQSETVKAPMNDFEQNSGIDLEAELMGNLNGSMNLAFYDGGSITLLNQNALFTAGVKDDKMMKNVIERTINSLPPDKQAMITRQKVGGKDAYVVNAGMAQIYVGVDDNKFLIASGKPIFEKAINGDKDTGFAANLADDQLKDIIMSNRNILYLNMDEVVKTVNNFAMFLMEPAGGEQKFKEKLNAAGKFEYILATRRLEKDVIKSMLTIKTRFTQPFFTEVAQTIDEMQQ